MNFNPINLRKLDSAYLFDLDIRKDSGSPLILCKADGTVTFATGRGDKDTLVASFKPDEDLLIWAWKGQYKTDIFQLSSADIQNHYK